MWLVDAATPLSLIMAFSESKKNWRPISSALLGGFTEYYPEATKVAKAPQTCLKGLHHFYYMKLLPCCYIT